MATKTLYLTNTIASSSNHHALQDGGTAPTAATTATGWVTGTTVINRYSRMDAANTRLATSFGSTVQPDGAPDNTLGDCFRTPSVLSGTFAAANWTYDFPIISSSSSGKDGRIRVRLWRSTSATGASATEIGTARALSDTPADDVEATSTLTVSEPSITLAAEYLFVQVAWHITSTSSATDSDVLLRVGSGARVLTSDFTPGVPPITMTGAVTSSGTLQRNPRKIWRSTTTPSAVAPNLVRVIVRSMGTAIINAAGTFRYVPRKVLRGTATPSGVNLKRLARRFTAVVAPSGIVRRSYVAVYEGVVAPTGTVLATGLGRVFGRPGKAVIRLARTAEAHIRLRRG